MLSAPLSLDEDERLSALQNYQILDTYRDEKFDDLVSMASLTLNMPKLPH